MIIQYEVRNFYSIGPEGAVIDFAVDGNAPKTNLYVKSSPASQRASIVEAVIGPNASGKTKMLQSLAFAKYFLLSSYVQDISADIPFEQHSLHRGEPSQVDVKFTVADRLFEYHLVFYHERVQEEAFFEFSLSKERTTRKTLATRTWNAEKGEYIFSASQLGLTDRADLRRNASMLSAAIRKDSPSELARIIAEYWNTSVIVNSLYMFGNREDIHGERMLVDSLQFLHEKGNEHLLHKAKKILSNYDLGFNNFQVKRFPMPNNEVKTFYFAQHDFRGKTFSTEIHSESSGTQKILRILPVVLVALSSGGIAVVDEIDAFLHPDIVENIVDLFLDETTNPHHAQLLFTTHNHRLLNSLDKQQIILTEKNENGSTESWRLDTMTGVSSEDNYYTKYINGAYGARPKIGEA